MRIPPIALFVALTAMFAGAPSAGAATVNSVANQPGVLFLTDSGTERNDVRVSLDAGTATVRDTGAPLTPGAGCTAVNAGQVRCAGINFLLADLGNGDDSIVVTGDLRAQIGGGPGNDDIRASGGDDTIGSGDGDDSLDGGAGNDIVGGDDPGNDTLDGGAGDDVLSPGLGTDDVHGGAGTDIVSYATHTAPVTVTLDGRPDDGSAGEGDRVGIDVEDVLGGRAGDVLIGSSGPNSLDGGPGPDHLSGGAGDDTLLDTAVGSGDVFDGGDGNDAITSRDVIYGEDFHQLLARRDEVACGVGADTVLGDFRDAVAADCESVDRSVQVIQRSGRMTRTRRVTVRVRCGSIQPCAFGLVLRKRPRFTRLTAIRKATVPAGSTRRVSLRLSKAGARYVRRHRRVRAQLVLLADPGLSQPFTVLAPRR